MTRYWSIQDKRAWETALQKGYLQGNPDFICFDHFVDSYEWMKGQMQERLPDYQGEQPIWLWTKKPDMRKSAHAESGSEVVRLTIELPSEWVLLSDFDGWHMVLNDTFFAFNKDEFDAFYRGELSMTKEESWKRIFDFETERDEEWFYSLDEIDHQGVTGRIGLDCIRKVESFIAR